MTALFNAPSVLIGLIVGAILGAITVEKGDNMQEMKKQVAHANQVIVECEATLPRNQRCELTAKVVK